jgi:hypothetical protein
MSESHPRKRGGQPGNRNAFKYGFYSHNFTRQERVNMSTCQLADAYSFFVPQIQIAAQNDFLTSILEYEGLLEENGASTQRDLFLFFLFKNKCPPFLRARVEATFAKHIIPVLFRDIVPDRRYHPRCRSQFPVFCHFTSQV